MVSGQRNQRERAASESGRTVPKMPPARLAADKAFNFSAILRARAQ